MDAGVVGSGTAEWRTVRQKWWCFAISGGEQFAMQVGVVAVTVAAAFRRECGVAAFDDAFVHQLEVHVLEMRLDAEMVLEDFATGCAFARIVFIQRYVHRVDERVVFEMTVYVVLAVFIC